MYNKYGAKKSTCAQGHMHDSRKEAIRCNELHLLLRAKQITGLEVQKKFSLIPARQYPNMKNERSLDYVADFVYIDRASGKMIVEDCKGYKTKDYIIKRKLFKDKYCYKNGDIVFIET